MTNEEHKVKQQMMKKFETCNLLIHLFQHRTPFCLTQWIFFKFQDKDQMTKHLLLTLETSHSQGESPKFRGERRARVMPRRSPTLSLSQHC